MREVFFRTLEILFDGNGKVLVLLSQLLQKYPDFFAILLELSAILITVRMIQLSRISADQKKKADIIRAAIYCLGGVIPSPFMPNFKNTVKDLKLILTLLLVLFVLGLS